MPFLEQAKLFSETMNERFIEGKEGKSLIVFAIDTNEENNGQVKLLHAMLGDEFDLAYCLATAMKQTNFNELVSTALQMVQSGLMD